ncbi:alpha/beta fold hydrolase [Luteibacter aegosomatissinici]|uniref:alpha/beta fold hydrolase n=1 Tax=Luteibacter aegosomatissinici TaxID=2911539 RepID=UPI001FFAD9A9|nr:alpha/beta hydrolase [Luteibacter aegosomatissinici]UPG93891.1 alpha/beta hydrolase [Luteibacter aegosomatissinici]
MNVHRKNPSPKRLSKRVALSRVTLALAACLSLSAIPKASATDTPTVVDDPAYTHPQQLVEVASGRRLNLYCVGHGSPTVIFEAGMGDEAGTWGLVQPVVGTQTRACSYERAGLGFSDPADRPGTAANAVDDLHHLLAAANIAPPYVLVGHSYGGTVSRLYANLYPKEVAGMVLVDTQVEDWPTIFWQLDPDQTPWKTMWDELYAPDTITAAGQQCVDAARANGFEPGSELYGHCVPEPFPKFSKALNDAYAKVHVTSAFQSASLSEQAQVESTSADELRASRRWYGDMPLIVLHPVLPTIMPKNVPPDETQPHWTAETHALEAFNDQLAALSKKGEIRAVENTMHYIQLQQPEAVTKAVLDVVHQVDGANQKGVGAAP